MHYLITASSDYLQVEGQPVNLTSSHSEFIINVTIIDDGFVELNESFIANLSLTNSVGARVIIGPGNATAVVEIRNANG